MWLFHWLATTVMLALVVTQKVMKNVARYPSIIVTVNIIKQGILLPS
jgi:hypothetical protein